MKPLNLEKCDNGVPKGISIFRLEFSWTHVCGNNFQ